MPTRKVTDLPVIEKTVGPEWNENTKQGNWDSTRSSITQIFLHTMVGSASSANARFNNPSSNVSAHYGVCLDGSIWHWVDEDKTAYGCGVYSLNQSSIQIEHEDGGDFNGVRPDALYNASSKLVADICKFYSIPCDSDHIRKHKDVYATSCPDTLDTERIIAGAQAILSQPSPVTFSQDDRNALAVLHSSFLELKQQNGQLFGNLEGLTRELVADYPKYLELLAQPKTVSVTPPNTVTLNIPTDAPTSSKWEEFVSAFTSIFHVH